MLTSDAKCGAEIRKCVAISKAIPTKMVPICKNRNISVFTKLQTRKSHVWSALLYDCECWNSSTNSKKKLEATEKRHLRRLLKIPWKDRKTNEEALQLAGVKCSLIKTIRERQMNFLGHRSKKNGIEKRVLCRKFERSRSRGSQRKLYINGLNTFRAK